MAAQGGGLISPHGAELFGATNTAQGHQRPTEPQRAATMSLQKPVLQAPGAPTTSFLSVSPLSQEFGFTEPLSLYVSSYK